jgi:hypothetical protein
MNLTSLDSMLIKIDEIFSVILPRIVSFDHFIRILLDFKYFGKRRKFHFDQLDSPFKLYQNAVIIV